MRHDFLDRFSRLESPIHRLSPGTKLCCLLVLLLLLAWIPPSQCHWFLLPVILLLIVLGISRVPVKFVFSRILELEIFILAVAAMALFQEDGGIRFFALLCRGTLALWALTLFCNTTKFPDVLELLRSLRVPGVIVLTLALMYRYVFVLIDERERMARARESRSFRLGTLRKWQIRARLIGQLFVRTTLRGERIYRAMCARGWRA